MPRLIVEKNMSPIFFFDLLISGNNYFFQSVCYYKKSDVQEHTEGGSRILIKQKNNFNTIHCKFPSLLAKIAREKNIDRWEKLIKKDSPLIIVETNEYGKRIYEKLEELDYRFFYDQHFV